MADGARGMSMSPQALAKARRPATVMGSRVGIVARLFNEGEALCKAGQYEAAEEKWKQVLQVDQNDTRTQLHYAIMLRDKMAPQKKDDASKEALKQQAEQLLQQAMGDSYVYVSCGSTGPAKEDELAKSPKLTSPKKDIQRFQFRHAALRRTNVEFHALKTIRKQIASMELSLYGDTGGENEDDMGEWEEDEENGLSPLNQSRASAVIGAQSQQKSGKSSKVEGKPPIDKDKRDFDTGEEKEEEKAAK